LVGRNRLTGNNFEGAENHLDEVVPTRASSNPKIVESMKHKQTLIGNIIQPIEFAESAFFLFGDQVETGEILLIDACWSVSKVCKK
jgi:hypothetical protein